MYIFGGLSAEYHALGDLAAFVIASRRWYTFENMGPSPSPRRGHRMCVRNEKIFVIGGVADNGEGLGADEELRVNEGLMLMHTLDTSKIRFPRARTSVVL